MKVILLQDVPKLGKKDEVINAKSGYARNYLFPNQLAVEATKANLQSLDTRRAQQADEAAYEKAQAETLAEALKNTKVVLKAKVGAGDKIFGAITNKEIAEALEQAHNIRIDRRKIVLPDKIKELGITKVTVKLHPDVREELSVQVIADE